MGYTQFPFSPLPFHFFFFFFLNVLPTTEITFRCQSLNFVVVVVVVVGEKERPRHAPNVIRFFILNFEIRLEMVFRIYTRYELRHQCVNFKLRYVIRIYWILDFFSF